ncbi:serine/threonine protein kinase, putative [Plasmodium vivax]|uniref:Serine/threonine protein kinase, putative n=3 Tax=Plasmodium vivax TaxID=5855 RepID=A5KBY9_PLAVS|nr:serine/threonine protein kinase, putative [Plasmodium vivax]EDL43185.1 serine/threonine protein kinase, putative [Plasmodium vivax]KMZ88388.1 serine/threonine protein kinase [Plasmodium vivax Brazil I]KNA01401.1 serine/threonine protein kinase [Plasmodium vivax North Korean]|eukprot:XP_001612912.1 serine/threonine protein kinase [Plasmodium vivax Sal-1]
MREILRRHDKVTPLEKKEKGGQCFVNDYRVVRTVKEDKLSKVILCERGGNLYAIKKYQKRALLKQREFHKSSHCTQVVVRSKYDDLKNELEILADIKNDYCLTCDEIIANDDEIYLVNSYMENEGILQYDGIFFVLRKEEPWFVPLPVVKCVAKSILKSFVYIHTEKNICHRDVKPSNIFWSRGGAVKLGDFGESQYMANGMIRGTKVRQASELGTYEFMPPEFFSSGKSHSGEKADIWSLGISLYALFYRVLPFAQKESLLQLFRDIGRSHVQYPLDRNYFLNEYTKKQVPSCGPSLLSADVDFLKSLLRRDPGERPTSGAALKHEWLKDVDYACLEQYAEEVYNNRAKL